MTAPNTWSASRLGLYAIFEGLLWAMEEFGFHLLLSSAGNESRWLLRSVTRRARREKLISRLRGRSLELLDLAQVRKGGAYYAGIRTVAVDRIGGTETRTKDFDYAFRPLHFNSKERWLGIARAVLNDVPLPPVKLIRVDDIYYVRDGHHRVSVARALGQRAIEAEVTVWNTEQQAAIQQEPCLGKES